LNWAKWIISRATKQGNTVLDCFNGSGTTCVACRQLNRNFIGIEISPEYCKIAEQRLRNLQQTLI
jgi:site-specific DNA-methyltransferase (adenine-specific)